MGSEKVAGAVEKGSRAESCFVGNTKSLYRLNFDLTSFILYRDLPHRAVQMRTIIGGGNGGTNLGHLFQFAADQFSDAGALLSAQHMLGDKVSATDIEEAMCVGMSRECYIADLLTNYIVFAKGLFDCTTDHGLGLGPRTRSGVCAFDVGLGPESVILHRTRSALKSRRLRFCLRCQTRSLVCAFGRTV
ncbi:hypothetical protein LXL04_012761 [Taraxacum kok-saghyz]